jgi:hypothetical protein
VDADLDTLATALYVHTDDWLKDNPHRIPWRPKVGIAPVISDAEMVTLSVMQALLGYTSEATWLRFAWMWSLPAAQRLRIPAQDPGGPAEATAKLAAQRVPLRCSLEVAASPQTLAASALPLAAPDPRWPVSFNQGQRIESAMRQPRPNTGITLTQHSPWVWHVWLDDKRLGTVSGDTVAGFTARDIHHDSIGRGYVSAEAAMQAWVPAMDSHL